MLFHLCTTMTELSKIHSRFSFEFKECKISQHLDIDRQNSSLTLQSCFQVPRRWNKSELWMSKKRIWHFKINPFKELTSQIVSSDKFIKDVHWITLDMHYFCIILQIICSCLNFLYHLCLYISSLFFFLRFLKLCFTLASRFYNFYWHKNYSCIYRKLILHKRIWNQIK